MWPASSAQRGWSYFKLQNVILANQQFLKNLCFKLLRFCLEHGLPEAHGCGDAARRAARQQISRDGQLYSGSGRPDKKPDPVRKAQLQRKLDKKVTDLEGQRKSKPKKSWKSLANGIFIFFKKYTFISSTILSYFLQKVIWTLENTRFGSPGFALSD